MIYLIIGLAVYAVSVIASLLLYKKLYKMEKLPDYMLDQHISDSFIPVANVILIILELLYLLPKPKSLKRRAFDSIREWMVK